jgi:hypothetical protein
LTSLVVIGNLARACPTHFDETRERISWWYCPNVRIWSEWNDLAGKTGVTSIIVKIIIRANDCRKLTQLAINPWCQVLVVLILCHFLHITGAPKQSFAIETSEVSLVQRAITQLQ